MRDEQSDFQEPLTVKITARDAFWLMRYYGQEILSATPEFIVGQPNNLRLVTQVGPVTLVCQVWIDGTFITWMIEFPKPRCESG